MDKETLMKATADIRSGERCRILFDLLMQEVKGTDETRGPQFFELLREKLQAEQAAMELIAKASEKTQNFNGMPYRAAPEIAKEVEDQGAVSVSN